MRLDGCRSAYDMVRMWACGHWSRKPVMVAVMMRMVVTMMNMVVDE